MARKKITKPQMKQNSDPAYDWHEIEEWVRHKTGRELRDWAGKFAKKKGEAYDPDVPYYDMWHWICDSNEIHNPCYFWLSLDDEQIDDADVDHLFIREILAVLREEFPEAQGEMYCWVSW